ncbi:hypothetical protein HUN08_05580 [Gordonia sp. X0973]|uniref:hypothetical protein n=1 Tax=Gordonia sp. X0973 TaxID=2742602 RepID=UPI000F52683E|nr:hypothetical protein [Gordonia sp. X0973]QKT06718.1 hypothetical protein HUN08_05580 [Gordonia sp. X0973]
MTATLIRILSASFLLLWPPLAANAPAHAAPPRTPPTSALPSSAPSPPAPAAVASKGDRIALTLVSDVRENGVSAWYDSLARPRRQEQTVLVEQSGPDRLWTSTLVYTAQTAVRLTVDFTTEGELARCIVARNGEIIDAQTSVDRGGQVRCAAR